MKYMEMMKEGFYTACIDQTVASSVAYRPQFICNNYKEGRKVLTSIEDELLSCDQFFISVAFITMGGITPLLQTLKELENRGIQGKILTTDYLTFSEPKALEKLHQLSNVTIRMYQTKERQNGFHTKGYIFRQNDLYRMIIGSSNMTLNALTSNHEWNTKLISQKEGEYGQNVLEEFQMLWNSSATKSYEEFIDDYKEKYQVVKKQREIANSSKIILLEQYRLEPNTMQLDFIRHIQEIRSSGGKRALLISATGTGKTYASAFAMREINPKKALFLVHREQIAKQAMVSYQKVFGKTKTFGILSGNKKEIEAEYLFSTMQMMSKEEVLSQFQRDEFQMIVIDEAHRVGAQSYQKIMDYFIPEFWLGMTASPERTDDYDVYQTFHHNIAHEIRLQQALEENLLCPFHYFGITDLYVNDVKEELLLSDFNRLSSDERVEYIIEKIKYYGYSGDRVKGLIFCSSKKEAILLSQKFNIYGYRTCALSGDDSQNKRESVIEQLVSEDSQFQLDYIFTVDIFNEGVDIPEVNQIVMLRPTESPIVFVQQLGRGLRKAEGKEYVVILDFIGNYKNNFMIPIALSGDRSYNKDNIRRYILEGERIIPGCSTIHFDEIAKKHIFASIDQANFSDIKLIRENYNNLKKKLGKIPSLRDFAHCGEMDVTNIFDNSSLGSYYKFLVKYEKDYEIRLSKKEEKVIEFISKKIAKGKRIHELLLLNRMLYYQKNLLDCLKQDLSSQYHIDLEKDETKNIVNVMTNEFTSGASKKTYRDCVLLKKENEDYCTSDSFQMMLENSDFYNILKELIEFGIERYRERYCNTYEDTNFVLYEKYTYEDVCRLLNWETNEVPLNIGGYKYDRKTKTLPVFINYHKSEEIQDTIKYGDRFIDTGRLIAVSKQSRTVESEDVQNFLYAKERGIQVELFVRKNKDDKISKEFYYLGKMEATGRIQEIIMANTNKSAVEIEWNLKTPVREDIYHYIING